MTALAMCAALDATEKALSRKSDREVLAALVEQVASQLLIRAGEEITPELAYERARNVVAALSGTVVP